MMRRYMIRTLRFHTFQCVTNHRTIRRRRRPCTAMAIRSITIVLHRSYVVGHWRRGLWALSRRFYVRRRL